MIRMNKYFHEFLTMFKYGLVGILNTLVFLSVTFIFKLLDFHYILYTLFGYSVAIPFSFFMNRRFTFLLNNQTFGMMIKFFIVTISLLFIVQLIQYFLIGILGFNEYLGVFAGMIFYTGVGYVINRWYVFKKTNDSK